jgi:hypothetical protein
MSDLVPDRNSLMPAALVSSRVYFTHAFASDWGLATKRSINGGPREYFARWMNFAKRLNLNSKPRGIMWPPLRTVTTPLRDLAHRTQGPGDVLKTT